MMNETEQKIQTILKDLNRLDPSFNIHEPKLRTLVYRLIASKPNPILDQTFQTKLRTELTNQTLHTSRSTQGGFTLSPYLSIVHKVSKLTSGVIGAIVALLVAVPVTYLAATQARISNYIPTLVKDTSTGLSLKQQINSKGTNAFGKLASLTVPAASSTNSTGINNQIAAKTAALSSDASSSEALSTDTHSSDQNATPVVYVYKGDAFPLGQDGTIFKRDKGTSAGKQLADFVQASKLGLANLSTFNGLDVKNVELSEPQPNGYSIDIDFPNSVINILSNKDNQIQGTTSASTTLAVNDSVSIANQFLVVHNIDMSSYGQPFVTRSSSNNNSFVIVNYPLILGGHDVYDESGKRYGIQIVIDPSNQTVVAVNNLTSQVYESSTYSLQTNMDDLLSSISSQDASTTAETVELGTPTMVLMKYNTLESDGTISELYIPSLMFPVVTKDAGSKHTILVPLLKDMPGGPNTPKVYSSAN